MSDRYLESEILEIAQADARLSREELLKIADSSPYLWRLSADRMVRRLVADLLEERQEVGGDDV